jgi:hypothetical protein
VIVLVPTGTPFSADRQLEAERRHFGHDNNGGPAQPDRCRIALELDLLAQIKPLSGAPRTDLQRLAGVWQAVDREIFNVGAPR